MSNTKKVWYVELTNADFSYVLAESASAAFSKALTSHPYLWWNDIEWREVKKRRIPDLDGDAISVRALVERHAIWVPCQGCDDAIDSGDTDAVWLDDFTPFCSTECYHAHPNRHKSAAFVYDNGQVVHLGSEF